MVISDQDKILIKNLYQLKKCNARQLRTEFPDKGWTKSSINRLLKKFRDIDTVDRCKGSGIPRSARTDENIDQVNDMVLSQEDQHRTHSTVREISQGTGIPKSSMGRIIKKNLQLKYFSLQEATCVCKSWLRRTVPLTFSGKKTTKLSKAVVFCCQMYSCHCKQVLFSTVQSSWPILWLNSYA